MSPSAEAAVAGSTPRLFVALWPPAPVRARIAALADAWQWPPAARRVADVHLHATLHFIGAFPVDRVDALSAALGRVAPRPVDLVASGTAVWRGGIAVTTLRSDPALDALHRELGDALARLGIALDARPFAPHVTLARKAAGAVPPPAMPALDWHADGFALVVSRPGPPVRYERLADWGGDPPGA